ncbi:MAG TPA: hypothetical protein PLP58_04280, partial [Prosthecobacter sp.]|nr:hypothetical protein [Prosthecobacter sp.]
GLVRCRFGILDFLMKFRGWSFYHRVSRILLVFEATFRPNSKPDAWTMPVEQALILKLDIFVEPNFTLTVNKISEKSCALNHGLTQLRVPQDLKNQLLHGPRRWLDIRILLKDRCGTQSGC